MDTLGSIIPPTTDTSTGFLPFVFLLGLTSVGRAHWRCAVVGVPSWLPSGGAALVGCTLVEVPAPRSGQPRNGFCSPGSGPPQPCPHTFTGPPPSSLKSLTVASEAPGVHIEGSAHPQGAVPCACHLSCRDPTHSLGLCLMSGLPFPAHPFQGRMPPLSSH